VANLRSDWVDPTELTHILAALTPPNRLAMELALHSGLRISDVLNIRTDALLAANNRRLTIRERKTGKARRLTIPAKLYDRMAAQAGRVYVWPSRTDWRKPRTRQAVYKDVKRAAKLFRAVGVITPHSARKTWAVGQLSRDGDIQRVQRLMQHSDPAVTAIYALANVLTTRKKSRQPPTLR